MKSWLRMVVGFFVFCVVLVAFIYAFGPASLRQGYRGESPVGQLNNSQQLESGGQPAQSK